MDDVKKKKLVVLHLIRSYGRHGGEQQLSRMMGASTLTEVIEHIAFLFKDHDASSLFNKNAPLVNQHILINKERPTGKSLRELYIVLRSIVALQLNYARLVNKLKPDVCCVYGFQAAIIAWPIALLMNKPVHAYIHRITKSPTLFAPIFGILYAPYALIGGNSKASANSLMTYKKGNKVVILENGIDISKYQKEVKNNQRRFIQSKGMPFRLITVGRLLDYKGQDLIIKAINLIKVSHPDIHLSVVGDGVYKENLEELVEQYKLSDNVTFMGFRDDIPKLLSESDIFVYASRWEGMSNSVVEAMASGLPSVVSDAPGVSECHINNETALIVKRDHESIARAITQLLDNTDLCIRMSANALDRVAVKYSIDVSRGRYEDLFRKLNCFSNKA